MSARIRWDDFVLDLDAYRLERGGVPLALEPKAFNLLALMAQRPDHLFTKQEIFDRVWPDTAVSDHALTRIVAQIRRVLGDEAREARYLETVPTRGYRWIHPVEVVDAPAHAETIAAVPFAAEVEVRTRLRLLPWIATGVVLATIVAALVWARSSALTGSDAAATAGSPATGEHDIEWPVQVTTNAGLDLHPTLSPHGDAVAFVTDRSGSFEIVVRALAGTATEVPLTSDGGQNVQPSWSPDGRFIAYHSYRYGGVWIVPSRGGTPKQIVTEGSKPAWSPDGTRIAFQSDEHADAAPTGFAAQEGSTIRIVSPTGGSVTELTRSGAPAGGHAAPSWSPDGRYLCFAVFDGGPRNGLWLLDVERRETRQIHRGDDLYESVFSPDGSSIYIAGGDALVSRLPFDAARGVVSGPRSIIPVPGVPGVRGIAISTDGSRLAFAGLGLNSQIWVQPLGAQGAPSGSARALTSDTSRRNSLPMISPDGSKLAYISSRRGERPNVWVMDIDGRHPLQLTSDAAFESQPEWSQDGTRIAFQSKGGEEEGLLSIDVATRKTQSMIDVAALRPSTAAGTIVEQLAEARLSPSWTQVAYSLREPPSGRRVLYLTALDAIAPRRLTDPSVSAGYPSWSPDERRLAVEIKEGSSTHAGVVDVETGVLRRLTNARGQTWVRSWSPDGGKIAAAVLREGRWSLRALAADGSGEHVITPAVETRTYVRYPDWSSRGDLIVYERAEMVGNIWMLQLR